MSRGVTAVERVNTLKRSFLVGGLAALAITTGALGSGVVQATTPASVFTVAAKYAGGPVHLTKTKHYDDGSTSYTFEGVIAAHPQSMITYVVNTDNAGTSAAQLTSISLMSAYNKPLFKGQTRLVKGHGIWIVRERGGSLCRDSMGTYWHTSAYAVTLLSADTAHCGWMDDATVKASTAIYARLP